MPAPDGAVRWRDLLGEVWTGCFAVTSSCADIPAALRWADALYAAEGALLAYAGVENRDYTVSEDGSWAFIENMSYDEIGAIVGISAKNVSVRLFRIKEQLKKMSNQ